MGDTLAQVFSKYIPSDPPNQPPPINPPVTPPCQPTLSIHPINPPINTSCQPTASTHPIITSVILIPSLVKCNIPPVVQALYACELLLSKQRRRLYRDRERMNNNNRVFSSR